jgi:hypothetical protein
MEICATGAGKGALFWSCYSSTPQVQVPCSYAMLRFVASLAEKKERERQKKESERKKIGGNEKIDYLFFWNCD